jgi:hypothetical protein
MRVPLLNGGVDSDCIKNLEISVGEYLQVIATFESERLELQRLRETAGRSEDSDLNLVMNQRAIELLQTKLAALNGRLETERSRLHKLVASHGHDDAGFL